MDERRTVLLIDDQPAILEAVTYLFAMEGLEPLVTQSGLEGLDLAQRHHPDLIVCNLQMPELDGLEVLKRLRDNPQTAKIPFILFTFDPPEDLREEYTRKGADALVRKESAHHELIHTVQHFLNGSTEERHQQHR